MGADIKRQLKQIAASIVDTIKEKKGDEKYDFQTIAKSAVDEAYGLGVQVGKGVIKPQAAEEEPTKKSK